jgi:peptidoglycan L-alanyl-D-glutamate endopeptidase CwlK
MPSFGSASLRQLNTCHPDLQRLFKRVVEFWDCSVIEGKRSEAQQKIVVATGASLTLNSKHVYPLDKPSLAVDVAPYPIKWNDYPRFYAFAGFVIGTAREMGIKLRYGGDWDSDRDFAEEQLKDLVHFEIA